MFLKTRRAAINREALILSWGAGRNSNFRKLDPAGFVTSLPV